MSYYVRDIFVFGSNLAGIHGAGSAKHAAKYHGAVRGQGIGWADRSYAIPTKDQNLKVLPLHEIRGYVRDFLEFAREFPRWRFEVVAIGCGLAGYKAKDIAPMFRGHSDNVELPPQFYRILHPPVKLSKKEIADGRAFLDEVMAKRRAAAIEKMPKNRRLALEYLRANGASGAVAISNELGLCRQAALTILFKLARARLVRRVDRYTWEALS